MITGDAVEVVEGVCGIEAFVAGRIEILAILAIASSTNEVYSSVIRSV
jgi:hypothetical protein